MDAKKKSQVSLFVIIGIILVIVSIFLLYNSEIEIFQSHDTKLKNQVSAIVKDCIYDSAKNGANFIGLQGGYISIPKSINANPFSYTDFGIKIPNWDSSTNSFPTISSMENELESYILANSYSCIKSNLLALNESFDITVSDAFSTNAIINDYNIVIESELNIRFNEKNSNEILTISNYVVKLENIHLGNLYNLALEIYNQQAKSNFFEKLVLEQIHSANDYSSDISMPSEGMFFSCAKRIWTIDNLKKNLASMNNNNFKYLQFEGTLEKQNILLESALSNLDDYKEIKSYYNNMYRISLDNKKKSYTNYDVQVFMPSTEINNQSGYFKRYPYRTFDVTPSNGIITEAMTLDMNLGWQIPIPCIQIYHHLYTLDYDLIVKLKDSKDNSNFVFQFPIRIKIDNNEPKNNNIIISENSGLTFNKKDYCSENNMKYDLLITTSDIDLNPIDNVAISYQCMGIKCDMGTTQKPKYLGITRQYADPELQVKFPFCIGGYVIAQKDGYLTSKKRIDTDNSLLRRETFIGDNRVDFEMIRLKEFKFDSAEYVLLIDKDTQIGKRIINQEDGQVLVIIENEEYAHESVAIWPNQDSEYLNSISLLELEDIEYNITLFYTDKDYQLKGMIEFKNFSFDNIHTGNSIMFKVPYSNKIIEENNYLEFYEYIRKKSLDEDFFPSIY